MRLAILLAHSISSISGIVKLHKCIGAWWGEHQTEAQAWCLVLAEMMAEVW